MKLTRSGPVCFPALLALLALVACAGDSPVAIPEATNTATGASVVAASATTAGTSTALPSLEPPPATVVPATSGSAPATVAGSAETEVTATASVAAPVTQDITSPGADGLSLQATLILPGAPGPHPGVMLLHMLGSNRQAWLENGFAQALVEQGYAVLALDMRGHGDTGSSPDWALAAEDVRLAWQDFARRESVDAARTAIVGASIGANLALVTAAAEPAVATVVLLSPGLDYRGVTTEDQLNELGSRPLLVVASEEDSYAADSARTLVDSAPGPAQLEMYNGVGHGTSMFIAQPELASRILGWLDQFLRSAG